MISQFPLCLDKALLDLIVYEIKQLWIQIEKNLLLSYEFRRTPLSPVTPCFKTSKGREAIALILPPHFRHSCAHVLYNIRSLVEHGVSKSGLVKRSCMFLSSAEPCLLYLWLRPTFSRLLWCDLSCCVVDSSVFI